MHDYVIFDVDGTILDTERAVLKSLQQTLREEGRKYELEELRFALGISGKETLKHLNIKEIDRVHANWAHLENAFAMDATLFPQIDKVIKYLGKS